MIPLFPAQLEQQHTMERIITQSASYPEVSLPEVTSGQAAAEAHTRRFSCLPSLLETMVPSFHRMQPFTPTFHQLILILTMQQRRLRKQAFFQVSIRRLCTSI